MQKQYLTKSETKQIARFNGLIDKWVARGTTVENIRKCLLNNFGVMSQTKDGVTEFAISRSISDGRGGRMHKGQIKFRVLL